jgi:hypothetical protein
MTSPMASERVQVKLYARDPAAVELERFVPVFHQWIRDDVLDELVLDVVDYAHVHEGPGVVLVGHGSDYYVDFAEGRPGLLYSRKRSFEGDGPARLADAFARAVRACQLLEGDAAAGGLRFRTDDILVRIPDRLHAPNTDATFEAVEPAMRELLGRLFGGAPLELAREGDGGRAFTVRVRCESAPDLATLASRLK